MGSRRRRLMMGPACKMKMKREREGGRGMDCVFLFGH